MLTKILGIPPRDGMMMPVGLALDLLQLEKDSQPRMSEEDDD
jgi:hypothetical protein